MRLFFILVIVAVKPTTVKKPSQDLLVTQPHAEPLKVANDDAYENVEAVHAPSLLIPVAELHTVIEQEKRDNSEHPFKSQFLVSSNAIFQSRNFANWWRQFNSLILLRQGDCIFCRLL